MMNFTAIRTRYLRDPLPIRIGGIAANLARMRSFSLNDANREIVESVLNESKWFIEWTAVEIDVDRAAVLVELQIQLAQWQRSLPEIWQDAEKRQTLIEELRSWSRRILNISGLLTGEQSYTRGH